MLPKQIVLTIASVLHHAELQQVDIEYIPCVYLQFDKQKLFYTYQQLAVTRDILL